MFDIITIGNATLDIFLTIKEANLACQKDKCLLCLPYGAKIPAQDYTVSVGGNAANTAVGFSRLGLKTGILTILGQDETSLKIIDKLNKEKVATALIKKQPGLRANSSIILDIEGQRDRTILSYHFPKKFEISKIPQTKWLYLTSIGREFSRVWFDLRRQITQFKNRVKISFNPGGYEIKQGFDFLKKIVQKTEIFIVNYEEAQEIINHQEPAEKNAKMRTNEADAGSSKNTDRPSKRSGKLKDRSSLIKNLIKKLHKIGAKITVITDGEKGVYAYSGNQVYFEAALDVKPKEVTGAGDSFAAGFTSAIFYGFDLGRALRWGILNSNFCIQKIGAQNGLLNLAEIKKMETRYYGHQITLSSPLIL